MTTAHPFPRRTVFAVDAVLAAGLGVFLLVLAEPIAEQVGEALSASVLRWVGVGLLPWAAHNAFVARAPGGPVGPRVQLAGDALWIIASVALLVRHGAAFTWVGLMLLTGQLVVVGAIFTGKLRAVRG